MDKPLIQVTFGEVLLKEASFMRFGSLEEENYKIDVIDSMAIDEVTERSFRITYARETKRDNPFKFRVSFDFIVFLDDTGVDYYKGNLDKIKKFGEIRKVEIVNNMGLPARASLLIGNIVKELGNPFITQPAVITN